MDQTGNSFGFVQFRLIQYQNECNPLQNGLLADDIWVSSCFFIKADIRLEVLKIKRLIKSSPVSVFTAIFRVSLDKSKQTFTKVSLPHSEDLLS